MQIDLLDFHNSIKKGYQEYSMYFYMATIGAVISAYIGIAGSASFIIGLAAFYWLGKFHSHIETKNNKPDSGKIYI
jgi:hypothetical protein